MESNGQRNKIQVSQKTAELLRLAGKEYVLIPSYWPSAYIPHSLSQNVYRHWLTEREEKVECKGKGLMTTFWCEPYDSASGSVVSGSVFLSEQQIDLAADTAELQGAKLQRLVEWNISLFSGLLLEVMAKQGKVQRSTRSAGIKGALGNAYKEVQEEINLLQSSRAVEPAGYTPMQLSDAVRTQLRDLLMTIAALYQSHPFHNFEHCSHVVMSTRKMLNRIVENEREVQHKKGSMANYTFGVTSNPLNQFAIVFAALIHDLDHSGVSNAQLVEEKHPLAVAYEGRSVAEQNSLNMAWKLLMEPRFADLRDCIYTSEAEMALFRQVVVNAVMATDLFDKQLKEMRETRWTKSFTGVSATENDLSTENRKAAIVVDLIIQASDVSHTMQHFTVYKKWNMKLLDEMYTAYQNGRMGKDPMDSWYEGELWFFDNYIIPLAEKLRECQVFGVSCDEFLDYARDNRMEWEMKGREIVQQARTRLQSRALESTGKESFEI
jgi:3'5'-cyclic nucleotide phosphodiesterase